MLLANIINFILSLLYCSVYQIYSIDDFYLTDATRDYERYLRQIDNIIDAVAAVERFDEIG
jgi:pantothenate kinase-related protein Tda10